MTVVTVMRKEGVGVGKVVGFCCRVRSLFPDVLGEIDGLFVARGTTRVDKLFLGLYACLIGKLC